MGSKIKEIRLARGLSKKDVNKKAVGQRISAIRQNKGLSMKDFGKKIGIELDMDRPINDGVVSKWESGVNLPNAERLKAIADFGDTSVSYLLYGIDWEAYDAKKDNKEIAKRIKLIRVSKGLTMKEFGELISKELDLETIISGSLVSRWESGVNLPNNERLKAIADIAGISVAELMEENKPKTLQDYTNQELLDELSRRLGT